MMNLQRKGTLKLLKWIMGVALVCFFLGSLPAITEAATPETTAQAPATAFFVAKHKRRWWSWWCWWKPGKHDSPGAVPELNAGASAAAAALLLGGCLVLMGRRRRQES